MEGSIGSDGRKQSTSSSATSILGLKGSLRFRPHGSTQKPHVVLRRVEAPENSSDDGDGQRVVYYTLFAAKRIEVKPGKEILLAVPDSRFKDQPVVLEGDSWTPEVVSEPEDEPETSESEDRLELEMPPAHPMPPKMRKSWNKQSEQARGLKPSSTATSTYSSVAVQAQPEYATTSTQAQPQYSPMSVQELKSVSSKSVQAQPRYKSSFAQAVPTSPPPPPPHTSHACQTDDLSTGPRHSGILTDGLSVGHVLDDSGVSTTGELSASTSQAPTPLAPLIMPERQRSLSPMELDSPTSSPLQSPIHATSSRSSFDSIASSRAGSESKTSFETSSASSEVKIPDTHVPGLLPATCLPKPGSSAAFFKMSYPEKHEPMLGVDSRTEAPLAEVKPVKEPPPSKTTDIKPRASIPWTSGSASIAKRARSPPTGPRSLSSLTVKSEPSQPSSSKLDQDAEVLAAAHYSVHPPQISSPSPPSLPPPSQPPPPLPKAEHQVRVNAGFKRIGSYASEPKPTSSSSVDWNPVVPTPGNPLGIRPSVNPMRNGTMSKSSALPNAPAALQSAKKPIVVGSGWPFTRHQTSTNSVPGGSATAGGSAIARPLKPSTPPDNVPLPLPSPAPATLQGASKEGTTPSSTASTSRLSSIVPYASPSPPAFPLRLPSTQSEADVKSTSSELPFLQPFGSAPIAATATGKVTQQAAPVQVKLEETPFLPTSASSLHVHENGPGVIGSGSSTISPHNPSKQGVVDSTSGRDTSSRITSSGAFMHPLPRKPVAAPSSVPHKYEPSDPVIGVKRSASIASRDPESSPSSVRRRSFKWPTTECIHSVRVRGEENLGINGIVFNSDGSQFAVNCRDSSIRIWNNHSHTEVAKLAHTAPIVSVAWIDDDAGVVSLGDNGIVSKWTRLGSNKWHWAKILEAGRPDEDPTCLAYMQDRIAVAFPRTGVKVWLWVKGTWQPQRSILRQNVTAIRFVDDGEALLGGTTDGVLWYCQVPNGTLRAYAFFKSKVYNLDVNAQGTHALVAQSGGRSHLVGIRQDDHKGKIEQAFALKDGDSQGNVTYDFGAVFTNDGQSVLFGVWQGCVLVWDRNKGDIQYGLDHGEEAVQAVASFDIGSNHHLVTGTKDGHLTWWPHSSICNQQNTDAPRKRLKSADPQT